MSLLIKLAAPVSIVVPVSVKVDGGATIMLLTAAYKGPNEYADWVMTWQNRSDLDVLMEVVTGWSGVGDAEGQPMAFSRSALAAVLDQVKPEPNAAQKAATATGGPELSMCVAILAAYTEALSEGRRGN